MKIRLVGFRLTLNQSLSVAELSGQLKNVSGKPQHHAGANRIITVKEHDKYFVGSILTMKGLTKFTEIDLNSLKMSVRELEKGKNLAVFNFFLISKRNLNGLYSYYFSSSSFSVFGSFLNSLGKVIIEPKKLLELKAVTEKGPIGKVKKNTIREKFRDAVNWSYLVSKRRLSEILENWERVKSLEYTVTHLEPSEQELGGLKPHVRAKTTRLAFDRESAVDVVKKALLRYVTDLDYERGKIEGVDESGAERTIDLLEMPDWFGECDYSEILNDSTLFCEDVSQSCMTKQLVQEANDHPEYFDLDVK